VQISKTSEAIVAPGATLVYTLDYGNVGGMTATGVMITETVPASTTFNAAASSPGWSCPNGSPAGTICTHAVPDIPPDGTGTLLFAVTVDTNPATLVITNMVRITDSEGGSGDGGNSTIVGRPAPAPAMTPWAVAAALALLAAVARRRWR
jgi:uncharacterized repeat protein (TIGR01451 family)